VWACLRGEGAPERMAFVPEGQHDSSQARRSTLGRAPKALNMDSLGWSERNPRNGHQWDQSSEGAQEAEAGIARSCGSCRIVALRLSTEHLPLFQSLLNLLTIPGVPLRSTPG
jgi:hypothetical protein